MSRKFTGLRDDDSLKLSLRKAFGGLLFRGNPSCIHWNALQNPYERQHDVRKDQKHYEALDGPYNPLVGGNAEQEQTNRHLGRHQSKEGLKPFSISVFLEFLDLVIGQVVLVPSKPTANFWNVKSATDYTAKIHFNQQIKSNYQGKILLLKQEGWSSHPSEQISS